MISTFSYSQRLEWAYGIGSGGRDQVGGISTDASGNIYHTGRFNGTVDFETGAGITNLQSNGGSDIYVCKYDPNGAMIWARSFGGSSTVDVGRDIEVDFNGNVYVSGTFGSTVDFDPSPTQTASRTASGDDAFLVKFDSQGNFQWVVQFGGSNDQSNRALAIDNTGNVFVCGVYVSTLTYSLGAASASLSSFGSEDIFVSKINRSGTVNWVKGFGGSGQDLGVALNFDRSNQLYVCGDFSRTVDFDPSPAQALRTSNGGLDAYLMKMDTSGQLTWVQTYGGSSTDRASWIAGSNFGQMHLFGYFESFMDFDASPSSSVMRSSNGNADAFVLALSESGQYKWVNTFGGSSKDVISGGIIDKWGNIYGTGYFLNSVDFDPGPGNTTFTSQGNSDGFVQRVDSAGNFEWAFHYRGGSAVVSNRLAFVDPTTVTIGGSFEQTADFDPSVNVSNLTSAGNRDIFFLRFDLCNITTDSVQTISCTPVLSPSGKYIWTTSGTYNDTLLSRLGCDSILLIDVTIDTGSYDTIQVTSCGTYTSPSGNYQWNSPGIYQDTLSSSLGCDSILTIDLTIGASSSFSLNATACDSYLSPSGKTISTNGLYFDTIPNAIGCDSLLTIFLQVNSSSSSSQTVSSCNQYVSPTNKIYTSSGIYKDTLTNSQACDSIITTVLTIQSLSVQVTQIGTQLIANQNGVNYQWLDCGANYGILQNDTNQSFTPTISGDYAVALDNGSCIDTSSCINVLITGLDERSDDQWLKLYPNPASGQLFIESDFRIERAIIFDNSGRSVQLKVQQQNRLDISQLAEGLYYIQIETDSGLSRKKLVISR